MLFRSPIAATSDVDVQRLRVPRIDDDRTVLHVLVRRYVGALYDVVQTDNQADLTQALESLTVDREFDVDPRDDPPSPGVHLFMAPPGCCSCDSP